MNGSDAVVNHDELPADLAVVCEYVRAHAAHQEHNTVDTWRRLLDARLALVDEQVTS